MNLQGDYLSVWVFHDRDFMSDFHSKGHEFNDPLGQLYNVYTFQQWNTETQELDHFKPFEALFILTNLDDKLRDDENMLNIFETLFKCNKDSELYKTLKYYRLGVGCDFVNILIRGRYKEPGFNIEFTPGYGAINIQSWRLESTTKPAAKT